MPNPSCISTERNDRRRETHAVVGNDDSKVWVAGVFDRAASTYDEVAGAYHEYFGQCLVDAVGVAAGDAVLDVGCGRGAMVVAASSRVGPNGRVVGVDLAPEMIRLARERARAAGIEAELEVMDAEDLDLPDATFAVVLCGFGVFFLPDPERAAAGFRRVLSPGGRIGLSTWGAEDQRWSWEDELLGELAVERRAVKRPFDQPGDLEVLLGDAGFEDVAVHVVDHEVTLSGAEEWWTWKWSYSLRGMLEQVPPSRLEQLQRDAFDHIAAMPRDGQGRLGVRLEALLATGRAA